MRPHLERCASADTVVTTTSITAVSASTRRAQSNVSEPDCTQFATGTTSAAASPATKERKIGQLSAHEMNSAPVVSDLATVLPSMRLPSPDTMAANKGKKTKRRREELTALPRKIRKE